MSEKLRLFDDDINVLKAYSDNLPQIYENALRDFDFKVVNKGDKEEVVSEELETDTLSPETEEKLRKFACDTFYIADRDVLFSIFKALIDHQLRIVQYYRLFEGFYRGENCSRENRAIADEVRENLKKYGSGLRKRVKKQLKVHDSDKLVDDTTMKHYISQEAISKINLENKLAKMVFAKIARALRRIHGDHHSHHNEYYNYQADNNDMTECRMLEHVIDVSAIGDKNCEIPGQFYESQATKGEKDSFKNFRKEFGDLITNIYKLIREERYFFGEMTEAKQELEKIKKEPGMEEKAAELRAMISKKTEDIVWSSFGDGLDDTMRQLKEFNMNLYFAIEEEWDGEVINKQRCLNYLRIISDYKKEIFEKDFNLEHELSRVLRSGKEGAVDRVEQIIKVSAILESLKNLGRLDNSFEEYALGFFGSVDREKIEAKRKWIASLRKQKGDIFYVAANLKK